MLYRVYDNVDGQPTSYKKSKINQPLKEEGKIEKIKDEEKTFYTKK